ncbi:ribonuclease H-like domain-containing protein [Rhodothermus marinus]|nr:ribonuclease H-like domain-containing protein [Rhodothermus marinus]
MFMKRNTLHYVAFDIETCPLPQESYSKQQHARLAKEMHLRRKREPDVVEEAIIQQKAASLHPLLGWIVCISVQRAVDNPFQPNPPHSYLAPTPDDERDMLERFWHDVQQFVDRRERICWITFNGKRFDVPFLLARTLHHGLAPVQCDLLDTYPYNQYPHCDLSKLFEGINLGLADLCALLNVSNPKEYGDGNQVQHMLETEGIEAVRRYCEADVEATMQCFARLLPLLPPACQPRG